MKMPQNFVQGPLSIKLTKVCHRNRGKVLASSLLLKNLENMQDSISKYFILGRG